MLQIVKAEMYSSGRYQKMLTAIVSMAEAFATGVVTNATAEHNKISNILFESCNLRAT